MTAGGERSVLGYTLDDRATCDQIYTWREMHYNTFFNKQRIVTEKDLEESLAHYAAPGSVVKPSDRPRAHPALPRYRDPSLYTNQAHHTSLVRGHFRDTPCNSDSRHSVHVISDTEEEDEVRKPKIPNVVRLARMVKRARDKFLASIKYTPVLLRKPLKEQPQSCLSQDKLERLSNNFTTLKADPNPWDPNSYYNTHFPILLRRKQRGNTEEETEAEQKYASVRNRPEISTSYFDRLPLGRITSAEINLHSFTHPDSCSDSCESLQGSTSSGSCRNNSNHSLPHRTSSTESHQHLGGCKKNSGHRFPQRTSSTSSEFHQDLGSCKKNSGHRVPQRTSSTSSETVCNCSISSSCKYIHTSCESLQELSVHGKSRENIVFDCDIPGSCQSSITQL